MKEYSGEIDGHIDFEIGEARKNKLIYYVSTPDEDARGLVLFVPGCGADADNAYSRIVRRVITETYNLAVVTVRYHALACRPGKDWMRVSPDPSQAYVELDSASRCALTACLRLAGQTPPSAPDDHALVAAAIDHLADEKIVITGTTYPALGEYQNFGVLQALDNLKVLGHLIHQGLKFDQNNIWCVGSSHGGYLAHLIRKFAPGTIAHVLDNSGYPDAQIRYCGSGYDFVSSFGDMTVKLKTHNKWNFQETYAKNFFSPDRFIIRETANLMHLHAIEALSCRPPQVDMLVSSEDKIFPFQEKVRQAQALEAHGAAVTLDVVTPDRVDGKIFKTTQHAMGLGVHSMFQMYHDLAKTRDQTVIDFTRETEIVYPCHNQEYVIKYTRDAPYVQVNLRQRQK